MIHEFVLTLTESIWEPSVLRCFNVLRTIGSSRGGNTGSDPFGNANKAKDFLVELSHLDEG